MVKKRKKTKKLKKKKKSKKEETMFMPEASYNIKAISVEEVKN